MVEEEKKAVFEWGESGVDSMKCQRSEMGKLHHNVGKRVNLDEFELARPEVLELEYQTLYERGDLSKRPTKGPFKCYKIPRCDIDGGEQMVVSRRKP